MVITSALANLSLWYPDGYFERCERLLATALDNVDAYAALRGRDPGPRHHIFDRLAALPALTKRELRAFFPKGLACRGRDIDAGIAREEIEFVETSGSTGDRCANIWNQEWWDASERASWKLNRHTRDALLSGKAHREAILTHPLCTGVPCKNGYLPMRRRKLGRFLYLNERFDPAAWTARLCDRMVHELDAFRPKVLEANPSFCARLARHLVRKKIHFGRPKLIILTYECPSAIHVRQIRSAFDAPVISSYGSTEAGYVFMECECGRLHQNTAFCHVDFLPFAARHNGPATGKILVTTFGNPWSVFLRFDIGDIVRIARDPCPCGRRNGLTLEAIEGRMANLTISTSGRAVTQRKVDAVLAGIEGVEEYELRQRGPASYAVRFVAGDRDAASASRDIVKDLTAVYGKGAEILARPVPRISIGDAVKYQLTKAEFPIDADALLDRRFVSRP
jgi:phenylacetate-coenzyme A ligase PaaK-like adenylate-forming protein